MAGFPGSSPIGVRLIAAACTIAIVVYVVDAPLEIAYASLIVGALMTVADWYFRGGDGK